MIQLLGVSSRRKRIVAKKKKTERPQIGLLLLAHPSILPPSSTSFVSFSARLLCPDISSRAFVLLPLSHCFFQLLFNPPSPVICLCACLAVPLSNDMHRGHLAVNPGTSKSSRLVYTLSSAPEHVPPSPQHLLKVLVHHLTLSDALRPSWHRLRSCATELPRSSPPYRQ